MIRPTAVPRRGAAGCLLQGQTLAGKKKKKSGSFILTLLLLICIGTFAYSGYKLVRLWLDYKAIGDEYKAVEAEYTSENTGAEAPEEETYTEEEKEVIKKEKERLTEEGTVFEDAEPPLKVNFEELRAENPDIVGWIYVDAFPETISYPVCRGTDNDYYLHRTFKKTYLFSGAIFENCENSADFSDPHTIIYGHNMKNRSMFGNLKFLKEQERYDEHPYFWILTPDGNYRYRIFAAFDTESTSDVYTLFSIGGSDFLSWEKSLKERSAVKNDTVLRGDDLTVTLSTCTADSNVRCVVIGKCVSSVRPDFRKKAGEKDASGESK